MRVPAERTSRLRIEHRGLTPHQHVALARERQAVLGPQLIDIATVLALPRALLPNIRRDALVEASAVAEHEHVHVGDRAEGLVAHATRLRWGEALMLI